MIKRITNNWGLKLGSLVLAALLWILITNINDPVMPIRFSNIPVTLRNMNKITDDGKVYEVLDDTDVIGVVTIYAPRSVVDSLSRDNIIATADFENYTTVDGQYRIGINLSTNKYSGQIESISGSIDTVKLSVEERSYKTLRLTATTSGTLPDGYIIGDTTTEVNQIRITGPTSVVSNVSSASVNVEVTGYTSNIGTVAEVKLFDENGEEVKKDNIQLSINSVSVNVTILATKRVPLEFTVTGTPASGYLRSGEITASPDTVLLAGGKLLEGISSVQIYDSSLDISGLTEDLNTTINISSYLPAGTTLGDREFSGVVTVTVPIEEESERTLDIPYRQVKIENVPDGYSAKVLPENNENSFDLRIQGLEENVSNVSASAVTAVVDMQTVIDRASESEAASGNYRAAVSITLPEGISTDDQIRLLITLAED